MSKAQRAGSHTVSWLTTHIVWVTKYSYKILEGDIQRECSELFKQIYDVEDIKILKGVVSRDHVHINIDYRPLLNLSDIVKRQKDRTSRRLQEEYPELSKRYWGGILALLIMELGVQAI